MPSQEVSGEFPPNEKPVGNKLLDYAKDLLNFVVEFKSAIIIICVWILVSEIAGYSIFNLLRSIFRLLLYPLNLVLFNMKFSAIDVPEVFFLLVPLITLITIGFLVIISTED